MYGEGRGLVHIDVCTGPRPDYFIELWDYLNSVAECCQLKVRPESSTTASASAPTNFFSSAEKR